MACVLKYSFKISPLTEDDGGGFLLEVPDLPGCMTDGDTIEEAIAKAEDAIASWIETAKKIGKTIPEPKSSINEEKYSGKLTVRMPKSLHKELVQASENEGISLNQLILYYLGKGIGKESSLKRGKEQETPQTFNRSEFHLYLHNYSAINESDQYSYPSRNLFSTEKYDKRKLENKFTNNIERGVYPHES